MKSHGKIGHVPSSPNLGGYNMPVTCEDLPNCGNNLTFAAILETCRQLIDNHTIGIPAPLLVPESYWPYPAPLIIRRLKI